MGKGPDRSFYHLDQTAQIKTNLFSSRGAVLAARSGGKEKPGLFPAFDNIQLDRKSVV